MGNVTPLRQDEPNHEITPFAQEVIDAVKAAHPGAEMRILISEEGEAVICKAPNRGEYKRFRQLLTGDQAQRAAAPETLLYGCTVYPPPTELGALLERRPGLGDAFGEQLAGWAGAGQDVTQKKL